MKAKQQIFSKSRYQLLRVAVILMPVLLAGCASLQPRANEVSLQSYQQGCALRGVRKGMPAEEAQALCQCHVEAAIAQTSPDTFLAYADLIGNATPEQKNTEAFQDALWLMKETFNACRQQSPESS